MGPRNHVGRPSTTLPDPPVTEGPCPTTLPVPCKKRGRKGVGGPRPKEPVPQTEESHGNFRRTGVSPRKTSDPSGGLGPRSSRVWLGGHRIGTAEREPPTPARRDDVGRLPTGRGGDRTSVLRLRYRQSETSRKFYVCKRESFTSGKAITESPQ